MTERKFLSKKLRFEVFKRDSFCCQYCGQSAPKVILHVDHIMPVSEGGENVLTNLVTSCRDCNLGKSNRLLSDDAVVQQQKRQLDELQDRREQLEMMMEWQRGLIDLEGYAVEQLAELWNELVPGYYLNEKGLANLKKWVRKYEVNELIKSMRTSVAQYLKYENDPMLPTKESVEKAWKYVPRICHSERQMKDKPYLRQLYYARGILRKRLSYLNEWQSMQLMEDAVLAGASTDEIVAYCKIAPNWTSFRETMEQWIEVAEVPA